MLVNLSRLRERSEPLSLELDFAEKDLKIESDVSELERPAHVDLMLSLSGDLVRVRGRVSAAIRFTCCRCLKPIRKSVDKEFNLEYSPDPLVENEGDEFELDYDDLGVGFYRDDQLDLSALVGEQIVLEAASDESDLPVKAVKDYVISAELDLNEGQCGQGCVPRETIDPRL